MAETQAVTTQKRQASTALVRGSLPMNTMEDIFMSGQQVAKCGWFGAKSDAEGFIIAATCKQTGITLLDFVRTYHIIENKPAMRADAMLAEYRKRGGKHKIVEYSPTRAAVEFDFEGQKNAFETSMEEANKAGWPFGKDGKVKDNWRKTPADMLWARTISKGIRKICPEINAGTYTPEEIADFGDGSTAKEEKVVSPTTVIPPQAQAAEQAAPQPQQPPETNPFMAARQIDVSTCPCGTVKGKKWSELDNETLAKALKIVGHGMTDAHKAAISAEIDRRSAVTVDAEVVYEPDENANPANDAGDANVN